MQLSNLNQLQCFSVATLGSDDLGRIKAIMRHHAIVAYISKHFFVPKTNYHSHGTLGLTGPQTVFRYLLCTLVCMALCKPLCVIAKYKTTWFEAKMAWQLLNVSNIKCCFLSNDGHSVPFVNRFGKCISSSSTILEMFFFTWFLVDKFSPRISAYHPGPYRFMTNKSFVTEVKIKVEFSELSQKAFAKIKQFRKPLLSMENSVLLKGLMLRAPKSLVFWGCF